VLGLAQQVDGGHERVSGVVGDDEDLGGAGKEVDADLAEELALRLGDIGVARAHDHVNRIDGLGADGERRDGLDAADQVDLVGAGEVHGRNGCVGDDAAGRGCGCGHALHAGDLRGQDGHVGRGEQRVAPAGDVGTHGVHRDVLLAEEHARFDLGLEVRERGALQLGEPADVALGSPDVVKRLLGHRSHGSRDLLVGEAEGRRGPAVEALGVLADGRVAARADIGDDARDDVLDGRRRGPGVLRGGGGLEVVAHRCSLPA
jgi:hypothetical protein